MAFLPGQLLTPEEILSLTNLGWLCALTDDRGEFFAYVTGTVEDWYAASERYFIAEEVGASQASVTVERDDERCLIIKIVRAYGMQGHVIIPAEGNTTDLTDLLTPLLPEEDDDYP